MTAQLVDTYEGFARLESLWAQVEKAGGVKTPFQSFAWIKHWLQYRGTDTEPFLLILDDGATIAPFCRRRLAGFRLLCLLGSGDSDLTGLVTTLPAKTAWDTIGQELAHLRGMWDLLHLNSVRERDVIVSALTRHIGSYLLERPYEVCPWVPTNRSWETVIERRKKLRYEIKRWTRRLEEIGEISTEIVSPPVPHELIDDMTTMEQASWKWTLGDAALRPGRQRDFLLAVLGDPSMAFRIWLLRISNQLAAFAVILESQDKWYYYLCAYRQDFPHAGSYLLSRIIQAACHLHLECVTLLRGDHGYKYAWTDLTYPVFEIICPSNVWGRLLTLGYHCRWHAATHPILKQLRAAVMKTGDRRTMS